MTEKQLLELCKEIKDKFHLNDWLIRFFVEDIVEGDPGVWGNCRVTYGRKIADITLSSELLHQHRYTVTQVICHELVHVHLNSISESMEQLLGLLSVDMRNAIVSMMNLEIERATDEIGFVIADLMFGVGEER